MVGVENVISAVPKVWASPFSERAFAWRQAHMDQPEYVFPAVLLLLSVNSDKSGLSMHICHEEGMLDVPKPFDLDHPMCDFA